MSSRHVFYVRTGFHYFFSCQIIEKFNISADQIIWIMQFQPGRDLGVQNVLKARYNTEQIIELKPHLHRRAFRQERLASFVIKRLKHQAGVSGYFYAPYFNKKLINYVAGYLKTTHQYTVIGVPDGVNLLMAQPVKDKRPGKFDGWLARFAWQVTFTPVTSGHASGVDCSLVDKIYHYPSPAPLQIAGDKPVINVASEVETEAVYHVGVLLIGGESSNDNKLYQWLRGATDKSIVYKPHPRNKSRLHKTDISEDDFGWLDIGDQSLESFLAHNRYVWVVGAFSSSLIFYRLLHPEDKTSFLSDRDNKKDQLWNPLARQLQLDIIELV